MRDTHCCMGMSLIIVFIIVESINVIGIGLFHFFLLIFEQFLEKFEIPVEER